MTTGSRESGITWVPGGIHTRESFIQRRDPRLRILLATAFAVVAVVCHTLWVLAIALALALGLAFAAHLPPVRTLRRVLAMDAFMAVVLVMLPFTFPGETLFTVAGLDASREGLVRAAEIALKANAIVLTLLALVGTLEPAALGHALDHLRVPPKLIQLLLFTVRYLEVLHREYQRLRLAMRARAFRPRSDRHTWRSIGYLFGMLLVRSLDRSERVLAAMRCRGFDGRFHRLHHPAANRIDHLAGVAGALVLVSILLLEYAR